MVLALRVRVGKVRASGVRGLLLAPGASNKMAASNRNYYRLKYQIILPNFLSFGSIM